MSMVSGGAEDEGTKRKAPFYTDVVKSAVHNAGNYSAGSYVPDGLGGHFIKEIEMTQFPPDYAPEKILFWLNWPDFRNGNTEGKASAAADAFLLFLCPFKKELFNGRSLALFRAIIDGAWNHIAKQEGGVVP